MMNARTILFLSFESSVCVYVHVCTCVYVCNVLTPFNEMHNFRNVILNAITASFCVQHEVIHGVHLAMLSNNARVVHLKTVLHYWRIARDLGRLSVMQIRGISSGRTIKLSK